jgi:CxxC motif-containing protein (DUF1111 family)
MLCSRNVWRAATIIVWAANVVVADEPSPRSVELGRDLFSHEWAPNDPKSHGGDGLGPVYNDTSCVACHSQGGQGGAGAYEKNVLLMTALLKPQVARAQAARHPSHHGGPLRTSPTQVWSASTPGFATVRRSSCTVTGRTRVANCVSYCSCANQGS